MYRAWASTRTQRYVRQERPLAPAVATNAALLSVPTAINLARGQPLADDGTNLGLVRHFAGDHGSLDYALAGAVGTAEVVAAAAIAASLPPLPRALALQPPHRMPKPYNISPAVADALRPATAALGDWVAETMGGVSSAALLRVGAGAAIGALACATGLPITLAAAASGLRVQHAPARMWDCHAEAAELRSLAFPAREPATSVTHTHGGLAANRDWFYRFATAVATHLQRQKYDIQPAYRSMREAGTSYIRVPLSQKDPPVYHYSQPPPRPLYMDVDVGYYLTGTNDMTSGYAALLGSGAPVVAWAISSLNVPFQSSECRVVYVGPDRPGTIRMSITGSSAASTYEHEFFDLNTDIIQTTAFGQTTLSKVSARRLGPDDPHLAYVMVPEKHQRATEAPLGNTLTRFQPSWIGNVSATVELRPVHGVAGLIPVVRLTPAGCVDSYFCAETTWRSAMERVSAFKAQVSPTTAKAISDSASLTATLIAAAIIVVDPDSRIDVRGPNAQLCQASRDVIRIVCTALYGTDLLQPELERGYAPYVTDATVLGVAKATTLANAGIGQMLGGGMYPLHCTGNSQVCVQTRIVNVSNGNPGPPDVMRLAEELSGLICDDVGLPDDPALLTIQEVLELQNKPQQVARFLQAQHELHDCLLDTYFDPEVRAFQKNEAYAGCGDPRNISTLSAPIVTVYSTFTIAIARRLKKTKWYAFGMTPTELSTAISQRLSTQVTGAYGKSWCHEADFSRYDGHISHALNEATRWVFRALLKDLNVVGNDYSVFDALIRAHANCRASQGPVKYNTGHSRLSGSPETSLANSVANVFISYCTLRSLGCGPLEAYENLGFYGGDDSLVPVPDKFMSSPTKFAEAFDKTAKAFGMVTVSTICPNTSVTFLGRYHVAASREGPWTSIADVPRQLRKLDIKCSNLAPHEAALAKAAGLACTDASTPVLREWARTVALHAQTHGYTVTADEAVATSGYAQMSTVAATFKCHTVVTAALILERLDAAPEPSDSVVTLVNELLNGELDKFINHARDCLYSGSPAVMGGEDMPKHALYYYTQLGSTITPPKYCKISSAKLECPVPLELSMSDGTTLSMVTSARVTNCVARGVGRIVDVFGGPGAFAAIASLQTHVTSYVLSCDASHNRRLVTAVGNLQNHSGVIVQDGPASAHAADLTASITAHTGAHLFYYDAPWNMPEHVDATVDAFLETFRATHRVALGTKGDLRCGFNLPRATASYLISRLSDVAEEVQGPPSREDDCVDPANQHYAVNVLTHASRSLTEQNVVLLGSPAKASLDYACSRGMVWNGVKYTRDGFRLEPLRAVDATTANVLETGTHDGEPIPGSRRPAPLPGVPRHGTGFGLKKARPGPPPPRTKSKPFAKK